LWLCDVCFFFSPHFLSCPNIARLDITRLSSLIALMLGEGDEALLQPRWWHTGGGHLLLLWSNACHGPDPAAGHGFPWWLACSFGALLVSRNGRSLAICTARRWSRPRALACCLPPWTCLAFLPLPKVCSQTLSSRSPARLFIQSPSGS